MPGPRYKEHMKPKKGTIKRLIKSLWKNFKFGLIISLVALILSIGVNLCGSIFASLITKTLSEAIKHGQNAFTDQIEISVLNMVPIKANVTILLIALGAIYGLGVICSWTWTRTMAVVCQKYLNLFRIEMFSHMQKLPIKYFDTHQNCLIVSISLVYNDMI